MLRFVATLIMSLRSTYNLLETRTREVILLRQRIICSTPNITFDLLPLRRLHKHSH